MNWDFGYLQKSTICAGVTVAAVAVYIAPMEMNESLGYG
jgi:hypothetical protein